MVTVCVQAVNICHQSNFFQKTGQRRLRFFLLIGQHLSLQLLNIFDACLCFIRAFCFQFFYVARCVNNFLQKRRHRKQSRLGTHRLDKRDKRLDFGSRPSNRRNFRRTAQCLVKADAVLICIALHLCQRRRADSPFRYIDNPAHSQVISCIVYRFQVREQVFDFPARIEVYAAYNSIRNIG